VEVAKKLHKEDLAAGFAGVFLDDQLERKYPRAPCRTKFFVDSPAALPYNVTCFFAVPHSFWYVC
jgi:hypothetical protein